jgi:hypothetical protein
MPATFAARFIILLTAPLSQLVATLTAGEHRIIGAGVAA